MDPESPNHIWKIEGSPGTWTWVVRSPLNTSDHPGQKTWRYIQDLTGFDLGRKPLGQLWSDQVFPKSSVSVSVYPPNETTESTRLDWSASAEGWVWDLPNTEQSDSCTGTSCRSHMSALATSCARGATFLATRLGLVLEGAFWSSNTRHRSISGEEAPKLPENPGQILGSGDLWAGLISSTCTMLPLVFTLNQSRTQEPQPISAHLHCISPQRLPAAPSRPVPPCGSHLRQAALRFWALHSEEREGRVPVRLDTERCLEPATAQLLHTTGICSDQITKANRQRARPVQRPSFKEHLTWSQSLG